MEERQRLPWEAEIGACPPDLLKNKSVVCNFQTTRTCHGVTGRRGCHGFRIASSIDIARRRTRDSTVQSIDCDSDCLHFHLAYLA